MVFTERADFSGICIEFHLVIRDTQHNKALIKATPQATLKSLDTPRKHNILQTKPSEFSFCEIKTFLVLPFRKISPYQPLRLYFSLILA